VKLFRVEIMGRQPEIFLALLMRTSHDLGIIQREKGKHFLLLRNTDIKRLKLN
jgi:hypothetical protein